MGGREPGEGKQNEGDEEDEEEEEEEWEEPDGDAVAAATRCWLVPTRRAGWRQPQQRRASCMYDFLVLMAVLILPGPSLAIVVFLHFLLRSLAMVCVAHSALNTEPVIQPLPILQNTVRFIAPFTLSSLLHFLATIQHTLHLVRTWTSRTTCLQTAICLLGSMSPNHPNNGSNK